MPGGMPILSVKGLKTLLHPILLKLGLSYGEVCIKLRVKNVRKLKSFMVRDLS